MSLRAGSGPELRPPNSDSSPESNRSSNGLTDEDYERLHERGIDRESADAAGIRRVDSQEGAQLVGRRDRQGASYAGLAIPYTWPGESSIREYRLRRDQPDLEWRPDGSTRESGKYLWPPGRKSLIYCPPRATPEELSNRELPLVITEGEFKALALDRIARLESTQPRFLVISVSGVWNWRGKVRKAESPNGERRDVKGPIPDLDRLEWNGRRVVVAFDADGATNPSVEAAEAQLKRELERRGATVRALRWELDDGKGVDDLIANKGADHVLALIDAIDWGEDLDADDAERRRSQADILVELALGGSGLFLDGDDAFADVDDGAVRRTFKINSRKYKQWLRQRFYATRRKSPNAEAISAAVATLDAQARFGQPVHRKVYTRTAEAGGNIYIDQGDDDWQAIEIDRNGWRIVARPPVRFQRSPGMEPLPRPKRGGTPADLGKLLNVKNAHDLLLATSWLLAAFRPVGPYPVLSLSGEQGSAKSTAARTLRAIVDPNSVPLRTVPRDERDLHIAASHAHVLSFDNISGLSDSVSDSFCRLATGGGFATRALYTDDEEKLFVGTKPIIVNGIEDVAARPDLADRSIVITLEPIPDDARKPENYLRAQLEAEAPKVLGLLLDAVSRGLSRIDDVKFERLPRMADFAAWAVACGDGFLWPEGEFSRSYESNRAKAVEEVIESDLVGEAVRKLADEGPWEGSSTELLERLGEIVGEKATRTKKWPMTARALSGRLRRVAPALRRIGVDLAFTRNSRNRLVRISAASSEGGAGAS